MSKKLLVFGNGKKVELKVDEIGETLRILSEANELIKPRLYIE